VPGVLRSVGCTWVRAAIPLSIVGLAATGCARPTLDAQSAAAQILAQLQATDGPAIATVTCPDGVVVAKDATFSCTATEPGGRTWSIQVTQLDDAGTLDYRIESEPSP